MTLNLNHPASTDKIFPGVISKTKKQLLFSLFIFVVFVGVRMLINHCFYPLSVFSVIVTMVPLLAILSSLRHVLLSDEVYIDLSSTL